MSLTGAIYCDNLIEGAWFQALSPLLDGFPLVMMRDRAENVPVVADLLRYDRPDIILIVDDRAVLVVEKTREVPTGHNVGQRMARLIRAIEEGVPAIKFFPFEAMKHGTYAGRCFMNVRLLDAFMAASRIHDTPLLGVNWICDEYYELVDDGTENDRMAALVDGYLRSGFDSGCESFVHQLRAMHDERERRIAINRRYASLPASAVIRPTSEFLDTLDYSIDDPTREALLTREESVVYSMGMTPGKCRREDPYTGMQFIYDYVWCRSGPAPGDKHRNLILRFPHLTRQIFNEANPNDPRRKASNWYLTATAFCFLDQLELVHP